MHQQWVVTYFEHVITEASEEDVLLVDLGDGLDARKVAQAAVVVGDHGRLGPEAGATRRLLEEPEDACATVTVHDERPTVCCHRQPQEVTSVLQVHPTRCHGEDAVEICENLDR